MPYVFSSMIRAGNYKVKNSWFYRLIFLQKRIQKIVCGMRLPGYASDAEQHAHVGKLLDETRRTFRGAPCV